MVKYESEETGWSIIFPESWEVTVLDEFAKNEDGTENNTIKYPLFFQNDQFNVLQSTLTVSEYKSYDDWKSQTGVQKKALMDLFKSQGVNSKSKIKSEVIDGVPFEVHDVLIV